MQNVKASQSIRQMFLAVAGFVTVICLIESDGLASWANRLEPGLLRCLAVPTVTALHRALQPLGTGALRDRALDEAARLGWSDDAVRLARNGRPSGAPSSRPSLSTSQQPAAAPLLIAAANAPIAASVPRATTLVPLAPVAQGKPRVVALVGDSMMAVGLSNTLMRRAADDSNLRFVKAFRSGTGLSRPDVFNWMDEYPGIVGAEKPEVVIVAIGANDGQSLVVDDKVQLFGTAEWRKTYQARVAAFLAMVESGGSRVVWVGLPPMRLDSYNARIAVINRIVYTVVSQDPNATWWNSASFVGDETGAFREFAAQKDGRLVRLRNADGIHLSDEGAGMMSSVLVKWLDPQVQVAAGPTGSFHHPAAAPERTVAQLAGAQWQLRALTPAQGSGRRHSGD